MVLLCFITLLSGSLGTPNYIETDKLAYVYQVSGLASNEEGMAGFQQIFVLVVKAWF